MWVLGPRARAAPGAAHRAPCAQRPCTQQGWALPHSSRRCLQGFVPALGFLIKPRARRAPVPLLLLPCCLSLAPHQPPLHIGAKLLPPGEPQPGCGSVPPQGTVTPHTPSSCPCFPPAPAPSPATASLRAAVQPPRAAPCVTLGKPNTGAGGAAFPGRARWMCFVSQSLQALAAIDGLGLARGL